MTVARRPVCHVLHEDPDLAEAVPVSRRAVAVQHCVAASARIPRGAWHPAPASGIGLLVLDGLVLRRVGLDGRFGAELLGDGDLLRPGQEQNGEPTLTVTTGWRVLLPLRVAVLDESAAARFAEFPELTGRLVGRAMTRARTLAVNMAIVQQARVGTRLRMLLWHLADRWGRVRPDGVVLSLVVSHTVLAELVAARRPTVSTALGELARDGLVVPVDGGWRLTGDPPGELLELQTVQIAER